MAQPFRPRALLLLLCLSLLVASSAGAQYIYLDSNGDGAHTAADVLHGSGPTVVDVWLDTAHNRDGSLATCVMEPATPLTIFSYVVDLMVEGGTVGWGPYTNRVDEMGPIAFAYPPDSTRFSTGPFYTPTSLVLPAGKYHLGTLTIYPGSGAPSIRIVPGTDLSQYFDMTEFGSTCPGSTFGNTIVLGTDWSDADGLSYEAGGGPDQKPRLTQPADMVVPSGESAAQILAASDSDGQPLSFSKLSGPPYLFVTTTQAGSGSAAGEIQVAPFASDVGSMSASVSVSDGVATDQAVFRVTVSQGPDHPPYLPAPAPITIAAGLSTKILLRAADPDGSSLHFARLSGPGYFTLQELAGHPGGATAFLNLRPSLCDAGPAIASFTVTDGVTTVRRDVAVTVVSPVSDASIRHNAAGFVNALALVDLNGDGAVDLLAAHEDQKLISYYRGTGTGDFIFTNAFDVSGENAGIATADFDGDGHQDIAATSPRDATVEVLLGVGDGGVRPALRQPTGTGPTTVTVADFNRDGRPDLVTENQEAATVSVLLGMGDGTFGPKRDSPVGFRPNAIAVGDFNLDGRLDIAAVGPEPSANGGLLTVLPGLGDGAFGQGPPQRITGYPYTLLQGDWNQDGLVDLAMADISQPGAVQTFRGRGDGTFDGGAVVVRGDPASYLFNMVKGDLDGDGNLDLIVSDIQFARLILVRGDGHGGFGAPTFLPNRYAAGFTIGDVNSDGRLDLVGSGPLLVDVFLNPFPVPTPVEAKVYVEGGKRTEARGEDLCVRVQVWDPKPAKDRSHVQLQLDPASVVLRSEGTGSVSEIHAIVPKTLRVGDQDHDGIPEAGICFAAEDVAALFDGLTHVTRVSPELLGATTEGQGFCTTLDLRVGGGKPAPLATFAPNPLNPVTRLTFTTSREGPAKAEIYDIQGRRVRRLLDAARLPAGRHEFLFDGRGERGETLPSSVYFYRVETTEGRLDGRLIILK